MSNKPVAWRKVVGNVTKHYQYNEMGEGTPLYTHPVKELDEDFDAICLENKRLQAEIEALKAGKIRAYDNGVEDGRKPNTNLVKEPTDAEIRTIQDMCHLKNVGYNTFIMRFARAILRKAQEK